MEPRRRELLVARIVSGAARFAFEGVSYSVRQGGLSLAAQEKYDEAYEGAIEAGVFTEEDCLSRLKKRGLWTDADEKALTDRAREIDDFKVALYTESLRSGEKRTVKKALALARAEREALYSRRHQWSFLTCSGLAQLAKLRHQAGEGLSHNGEPVWPRGDFWEDPDSSLLLDAAVEALTTSRLGEAEFRELARTEPWASVWRVASSCQGVFPRAATETTDEQRQLVLWTQFYDNARQAQDCPPEEVFEDDDAMDGWAIHRRREAERQALQRKAESTGNEKIRQSQEVYLPAKNAEEARRIHELNDREAQLVKKQHLANVASKGRLEEHQRPEVQRQLQMEALRGR